MDENLDERQEGLTVDVLAERVDMPVRTIRFYISQGLLPGPGSRGKSATYSEEHVIRLRLIRRLVDQHVPLTKIAELVGDLPLDEARALLMNEEQRASDLQAAEYAGSPKDYVAALLRDARAAKSRPMPPRQAVGRVYSRQQRPLGGSFEVQKPESASSAPPDIWQRWTLAPGIELQVRGDSFARYRDLIRRVLSEAGVTSDLNDN
jgi:DNA-binding transcriptional MerR regulator